MSDGSAGLPPFERLLEEHRVMIYRFLLVAVGPHEADDCFQETFLAALRGYPRLRHAEHLDRWLLRIATRKAIDAHRGRRRRPLLSATVEAVLDRQEAPQQVAGLDLGDPLWRAVAQLPPRQRVALVHRHVLDRSYDEIAGLMDCSPEAARANVYQGTKKLREEMVGR